MRCTKTFSMVLLALIAFLAPALLTQSVKADNGTAKVYILMLPDVGSSWVNSVEDVKDGAIEACMLKGKYIHENVPRVHPKPEDVNYPPYYSATPSVITSWTAYKNKIIHGAGLIIVNTHGEILPVPNNYTKEEWVDEISEAMLTRRITWVHVAMYPFYSVKYEDGACEAWNKDGFKYFMSHINKGYVDCDIPPSANIHETTPIELTEVLTDKKMIGNWAYSGLDGRHPISDFWHAQAGKPLKWSDFKDYLIMPLYEINDTGTLDVYLTGAVIAYVKAGQRYLTDYGCGAYVHLGVRYFEDAENYVMPNTDFGRGLIGVSAALWVEANRFKPSDACWEKSVGDRVWNATVFAHPTVIGFEELGSSYVKVTLGFGIHGIYKFPEEREGMGAKFVEARFGAWIDDENWSDVRLKADINNPALSKQAIGFGTELSGLNTQKAEEFRSCGTSTIIYLGSMIPGVGYFFMAIEGLRLAGQWGNFFAGGDGIDEYDELVYIDYDTTSLHSEPIDSYVYAETSSIVVVDVRIPTSDRDGWRTLPLTYYVDAQVQTGIIADQRYWVGPIEKTIEIAIFFDRGKGQEDAGIPGDAGDDYGSAREINYPGSYHGFIDGTADAVDCYSFHVGSVQVVSVSMTPPPYVNFDLEVRRQSGYTYKSQKGPGQKDKITFTANSNENIKVKVYKDSGSGVYSLKISQVTGGCPTLFVWNGTAYTEECVLKIHAESDITLKHKIEKPLHPKNHLYNLQLRELDNFTSHIDQVKLYAVDGEGELHLCPLTQAYHNELGRVTWKLRFDDQNRVDLTPTQTVTLKFLPPIPHRETEHFIFEINGYNAKIP